jgi:hypothetical protein
MLWSKKNKESDSSVEVKDSTIATSSCSMTAACPRCGYPVEGLALVCPRCREELPRGCSGNCSSCGK